MPGGLRLEARDWQIETARALPAGPLKLDKIRTKFVFFKASSDGSTVGVVSSLPAGTMGDSAELDKTQPKFDILKFLPDERRKSPCGKIADPKPVAAVAAGRYSGGIIIAPEYKPVAGVCRSPGARGTLFAQFKNDKKNDLLTYFSVNKIK